MSTFGTSKSRFSQGRHCKNRFLMEIVLNEFRDRFLLFFESPGDRFSNFFSLENEGIVFDVTDPVGYLGPLKT